MEKYKQISKDSILIKKKNKNFNVMNRFKYKKVQHTEPSNFRHHIKSLPQWKQIFIRTFKENEKAELLVSFVQSNKRLIIVSNGSKSRKVSGGSWVIANEEVREILSEYNPDFGEIPLINSNREEIYRVLSVLLFLKYYCEYFKSQLTSPIQYYCDNKKVVLKVKIITETNQYYDSNHKIKDIDTVLKYKSIY